MIFNHKKLIKAFALATIILVVALIPALITLIKILQSEQPNLIFINIVLFSSLLAFIICNWRYGYVLAKTDYGQSYQLKSWTCLAIYLLPFIHYFVIVAWTIYHYKLWKQVNVQLKQNQINHQDQKK